MLQTRVLWCGLLHQKTDDSHGGEWTGCFLYGWVSLGIRVILHSLGKLCSCILPRFGLIILCMYEDVFTVRVALTGQNISL